MDDLIEALHIFRKYGNPEFPTHCEHDVMYLNIDYHLVSNNDKKKLDELGFFKDEDNDKFMSYQFGSF